jgi:4-hydroxy-tetrahydrodipicolinate reductase
MRIGVLGAGGRMGRALIAAVHEAKECTLAAAIERASSPAIGQDAGFLAGLPPLGVITSDELPGGIDGLLDFTSPAASLNYAALAAQKGFVHVIGTTGFSQAQEEQLAAVAANAVIVKSGNMSFGVHLLAALVKRVAKALDENFDIEIVEMHHRHKADAPSGTALLLGRAAAEGRGISMDAKSVRVRDGHTGPRKSGDIGFASLRGGSVVGDHSVIFAGPDERIELTHRAESRNIFANGAVRAALWAHGKPPGMYSMADVLGL